jgi:exopolysaccharide biosynthesis polyprenyl glycosylphosphotransferase
MRRSLSSGERVLVLGATAMTDQLIRELESRPRRRHVIVGVLDDRIPDDDSPAARFYAGGLSGLQAVVDRTAPHRIVTALSEWRRMAPLRVLFESYVSRGLVVEEAHEFYERISGKVPLESLTALRLMTSGQFRPSRVHAWCARVLSVAVAAVAVVGLAPLLALIAAGIRLDSPGPVLFAQRRVGAHGRPFTLLKFRTMRDGDRRRSEWAGDNLDRVTRFGRWLRRFRLDELPQLVNILRGEMNLVGPRPHPVSNVELFTIVARNLNELTGEAISAYRLRLILRPGLTGWAQVRYRYANNLDEEIEKLRYDLYYVKHPSLWLDLRILLETFRVIGGRVARDASASPMPSPTAVVRPPRARVAAPGGLDGPARSATSQA